MALVNQLLPSWMGSTGGAVVGSSIAIPTVYWQLADDIWHEARPLITSPSEVLTAGIDLSSFLGIATIVSSSMSYKVGHGLSYTQPARLLPTLQVLSITLSGGRRNTRHVLAVGVVTSDGQSLVIDCPVHVGR